MAKVGKVFLLCVIVVTSVFILYRSVPSGYFYLQKKTTKTNENSDLISTIDNSTNVEAVTQSTPSLGSHDNPIRKEEPPPSGILYLMQTEKCLPSYYQSTDVLGNQSLNFEVIVLSYKEACQESSIPHVQYLFYTGTTWTTGRNVLFDVATSRNKTYLYYVFMDDDIYLEDSTEKNPWRVFENFLRSVQPAVGCVDPEMAVAVRTYHANHACSSEANGCIGTVWFDAILDAFHYKAVRHILPYDPTYDAQTWWASQMAVIIRSEVLFRGQIAISTEVGGKNAYHRPYPRDFNFTPQMIQHMTQDLEKRVSSNHTECAKAIVEQWRTEHHWKHGMNSATLCLPPPYPHDEIAPGRYACL